MDNTAETNCSDRKKLESSLQYLQRKNASLNWLHPEYVAEQKKNVTKRVSCILFEINYSILFGIKYSILFVIKSNILFVIKYSILLGLKCIILFVIKSSILFGLKYSILYMTKPSVPFALL